MAAGSSSGVGFGLALAVKLGDVRADSLELGEARGSGVEGRVGSSSVGLWVVWLSGLVLILVGWRLVGVEERG